MMKFGLLWHSDGRWGEEVDRLATCACARSWTEISGVHTRLSIQHRTMEVVALFCIFNWVNPKKEGDCILSCGSRS